MTIEQVLNSIGKPVWIVLMVAGFTAARSAADPAATNDDDDADRHYGVVSQW